MYLKHGSMYALNVYTKHIVYAHFYNIWIHNKFKRLQQRNKSKEMNVSIFPKICSIQIQFINKNGDYNCLLMVTEVFINHLFILFLLNIQVIQNRTNHCVPACVRFVTKL